MWYSRLVDNGALSRCESALEERELKANYADYLRDEAKDREFEKEPDPSDN